ncbi:MAG TPA: C39 family peptidase [Nocardioidaceae bacterium]|nr:C39 family peptidase [Nocardioidaceae bacterium]
MTAASLLATGTTAAGDQAAAAHAAPARPARHIAYDEWATRAQLRSGHGAGVAVRRAGVRIRRPVGRTTYRDPESGRRTAYDLARWTSPWVRPGFRLTEAVASWNATTPRGTFIGVQMRGRTPQGRRSSWDTLGNWASHERRFHRTTLGEQADDVAEVAVDTLRTRGRATFARWQLRVTLFRRAGTARTPQLHGVGAMVSRLPGGDPPTTRTSMRRARDLQVPRRSQMIHRGHYPQFGNGGEAWCSPTSTTMLLRFWGEGPRPREYSWVGDRHRNADVDHAARFVYDYGYDGAGNWAFNTAYAHRYGMRSFVTRLRSLREAERFVKSGIPLAASVKFGAGELDGAPISSTAGHLMVIRGFTAGGDVIVNDPAARGNRGVRRVYDRGQFADAWVGGSGGLVYVIRPRGKDLPTPSAEANW